VNFNNDGSLLLTASDDKLIKLFNTENRRFLGSFVGHQNWVRNAVFSSDNRIIASGSEDKTIKLWDVNTGKEINS
jgi:WD40 repeat protein